MTTCSSTYINRIILVKLDEYFHCVRLRNVPWTFCWNSILTSYSPGSTEAINGVLKVIHCFHDFTVIIFQNFNVLEFWELRNFDTLEFLGLVIIIQNSNVLELRKIITSSWNSNVLEF